MPAVTHDLDLGSLGLSAGEGRRLELSVRIEDLTLAHEHYACDPEQVEVRLEVSRMTGSGYALRLRFEAALRGPCMRCLKEAHPGIEVDAREVDVPGGADELSSPYVRGEVLDLARWAHDAFALALPTQVVCREDCAGLCPVCAADLNEVGPDHHHERTPDPRWMKLRELHLD